MAPTTREPASGSERSTPDDVTAVTATLLLVFAIGMSLVLLYASRDSGGLANKCYDLLERHGTSACGRIRTGALVECAAQLPIILVTSYLVLRRSVLMWHVLACLSVSLLLSGGCYVFMRSWESLL